MPLKGRQPKLLWNILSDGEFELVLASAAHIDLPWPQN
jgi:hypothetical protein